MLHKGIKVPYALISPAITELLKGEYGAPRKSISARVLWANTQAQSAPGALDNSGSSESGPRFCRRCLLTIWIFHLTPFPTSLALLKSFIFAPQLPLLVHA